MPHPQYVKEVPDANQMFLMKQTILGLYLCSYSQLMILEKR